MSARLVATTSSSVEKCMFAHGPDVRGAVVCGVLGNVQTWARRSACRRTLASFFFAVPLMLSSSEMVQAARLGCFYVE